MLAECANSPARTTLPSPSHCGGSLDAVLVPREASGPRWWLADRALTCGFCGG